MTKLRVTVVNHARTEIACPPSRVWAMLLEDYGQGQGFARAGYRIDPQDGPSFLLGGYSMYFEKDGVVDDRICRVTERDVAAMRLSLHAEYLSDHALGMIAYATYQAVPTADGCAYQLDCHSTFDHEVQDGASREQASNSVAVMRDMFQQGLAACGLRIKAHLEDEVRKG
jgi:hypothetical protein